MDSTSTMHEGLDTVRPRLEAAGQSHLLRFTDELTQGQQDQLLRDIAQIDFDVVTALIDSHVLRKPETDLPDDLEPAPYVPWADPTGSPDDLGYDPAPFRQRGEELITAGGVAAFTVAGGQGTRLGWNGPKGTYPATVVTGRPLFRCFAEQLLAVQRRCGVTIPWYIMTSPMNDAATRAFFEDNNCFGLKRNSIFMFPQGVMPSFDAHTGRILLAEKHRVAFNPDGHGGALSALRRSGALDDMHARGVEHISYFQVDNPLVRVVDPLFVGLHATGPGSSAEMSSKMVPKVGPEEKVGVFCRNGGRTMVIEYSDLPEALARQTDAGGALRFNAGSIAIHIISVNFARAMTDESGRLMLPLHRAEKKAPHVDPDTGERIEPEVPNAVKLEAFIFDAIPLATGSLVYETSRSEEFAPIKNAEGADSPATSHQMQSDRAGAWLEANGVEVPRDEDGHVAAKIEISPLTALQPSDLAEVRLPNAIRSGEEIVL